LGNIGSSLHICGDPKHDWGSNGSLLQISKDSQQDNCPQEGSGRNS